MELLDLSYAPKMFWAVMAGLAAWKVGWPVLCDLFKKAASYVHE